MEKNNEEVKEKKTHNITKNFGRHLRKGVLYITALTVGATSIPFSNSQVDSYIPLPMKLDLHLPKPPKIHMTVDLYTMDAKKVAEESYLKTGHYDLDELRRIETEYFDYIKYKNEPADERLPDSFESIRPVIKSVAKSQGVDSNRVASLVLNECYAYQYCVGPDGELGYMQINPKEHQLTKAEYALIFDPKLNITMGTMIYKEYLEKFKGDEDKATMAYNVGPGNLMRGRTEKGKIYLEHAKNHLELMENNSR
jgi:hypothetical protein